MCFKPILPARNPMVFSRDISNMSTLPSISILLENTGKNLTPGFSILSSNLSNKLAARMKIGLLS